MEMSRLRAAARASSRLGPGSSLGAVTGPAVRGVRHFVVEPGGGRADAAAMPYLLLAALLLASAPPPQNGGAGPSWPGVWGPSRNGTAVSAGIPARPSGLKELWRRRTQGGYSEIVAHGAALFTGEARDGTDYIVSMEAATGKERWRAALGQTYRGHDGSHDGPIATPAVDGNDVFAVGPHGTVVAIDAGSGKERWRHDLVTGYGAAAPIYGFGTSPLIEGDAVLVQTSGENSRGLLAFDRASGKLLWNARHGVRGGYSSPSAGVAAGVRQIVASAGDTVFAVSPADGTLLWSVKGLGDPEQVTNPPQFLAYDRVMVSSWGESVVLKVSRSGSTLSAAEVWRSPRLRASYSPSIYRDGHFYGFSGPFLLCVDAATGDVRWRQRTYEGTLIGAGANLFVLSRASGELMVVEASPKAYSQLMTAPVFTPGSASYTGPSVVGNRMYLRNVEEIVAFSIEGQS
jgi:outer membrane protein assembly factor BamB